MSKFNIRQIRGDEVLEAMSWMPPYAFRATPPLPDREERDEILKRRKGATYVAAYDGDTPVATAAGAQMTQNVRGTIYPMAGIWGVVTHPAYRRKGTSRDVLTELLAILREKDYPFTCLYPFRESFYERLGYTTFHLPRNVHLKPATLLPAMDMDLDGEVRMGLIADSIDVYRDFVYKLQEQTHGMAVLDYIDRESWRENNRFWLAQAWSGGELVGLMLYDLKGEDVTAFKYRALRFYYSNLAGRYLLLRWIAQHTDQAAEVEIWLAPSETPETWLADMQIKSESAERAPMGRVLDVAKIGGMQVGPGAFSARIVDLICPWNEGVWRFEDAEGKLEVGREKGEDCELSIRALSALVYGTHDPAEFSYRGWGDPDESIQIVMRRMFPKANPYIHEFF